MFSVLHFGGGTNSTAMIVGFVERGIRPDIILFVDTCAEKPHTYEHMNAVNEYLEKHGYPKIKRLKRKVKSKFSNETLEQECLRRKCLPSLAYGWKTCSQKYKVEPQDKYIRSHEKAKAVWADGGKVIKYIGFDAGEMRRSIGSQSKCGKFRLEYPLIEWVWDRDECKAQIKKAGLPQPGKSSCFFCPATRKVEILELRQTYPELLERAIAMEANAENLKSTKGLGRRFSWQDFLKAEDKTMFADVESIPCICVD